jgi:hypothetical protein
MINFLILIIIGCVLWYVITYLFAMIIDDPKILKFARIILALIFLILIFYYGLPYLGDNANNYHLFHNNRL